MTDLSNVTIGTLAECHARRLDMKRRADWPEILDIAAETEDWSLVAELAQHMRSTLRAV